MKWDPQFFSVVQAATALAMSPQRVRVLLANGRLQGYQVTTTGGRVVWRVHLSLHRRPGKPGRPRSKRRTVDAKRRVMEVVK